MGLFDNIFKKKQQKEIEKHVNGYFQMLNGYTPIFSTYDGGVYEMELTRACIHTFASHVSKLLPVVTGADLKNVKRLLDNKPNFLMTSSQFLYRIATIFETHNTCFIVPILDEFEQITGYYPIDESKVEFINVKGELWLRYTFSNGQTAAMEFSRCGVVNKFLYHNDIRGEDNRCLDPTMQLLNLQNQGIREGIKNGASYRFMAQVANWSTDEDLKAEREAFSDKNLNADSGGGLLLFPNTYTNIQQINAVAKIVDPEQMKLIQDRVFTYFGTNEKILQNKATGDEWSAYYEGKIEPFIIQLSQAMTAMTYTENEISRNNQIVWVANRFQFMATVDKINMVTSFFDRGLINRNTANEILGLAPAENGETYYIRRDYVEVDKLDEDKVQITNEGEDKNADT